MKIEKLDFSRSEVLTFLLHYGQILSKKPRTDDDLHMIELIFKILTIVSEDSDARILKNWSEIEQLLQSYCANTRSYIHKRISTEKLRFIPS